jgi:hypothetical protein
MELPLLDGDDDNVRDYPVVAVRFRFWPSAPNDDVDQWTCGCGRSLNSDDPEAHWEFTVPVKPRRRPAAVSF